MTALPLTFAVDTYSSVLYTTLGAFIPCQRPLCWAEAPGGGAAKIAREVGSSARYHLAWAFSRALGL